MSKTHGRSLTDTEAQTLKGYDEIAESIEATAPDIRFGHHFERLEWYVEEADAKSPGTLLDVGCGSGKAINVLKEVGIKKYVGIDASQKMIRMARERFPHEKFYIANFYSISSIFPSQSFRYFFASGSLYHVPKNRMVDVLREISMTLETGAYGFITLPLGSEVIETKAVQGVNLLHPLIGYEWEEEELRSVYKSAGFQLIDPGACYNCGIITDIIKKD